MSFGLAKAALAAILAATPAAPLEGLRQSVSVDAAEVTLADLFDVNLLPRGFRQKAATLKIAQFAPGSTSMVISSRRVAERVRALVPVLATSFPDRPDTPIQIRLKARSQVAPSEMAAGARLNCLQTALQVEAGEVPIASDFVAARCGASTAEAPFHYDLQQKVAVATRTLLPGETVRAPAAFTLATVRPGQRLFLRSHIGVVTVERAVDALQAARPGQSLFVEAADHAVFSVQSLEVRP